MSLINLRTKRVNRYHYKVTTNRKVYIFLSAWVFMEQTILSEVEREFALEKLEMCMWKADSGRNVQIISPELAEGYNPTAYSLCGECDGTKECAEMLRCGNFFPLKYGE